MRVAAAFTATLIAVFAAGSTPARSDIVKIFHFDQDGVLPSADPQIELFTAGPSAVETDVYSVSGGQLHQRTFSEDGNYSYSFPDATLNGGGLDPAKSLVMEARLRILEIEGVDGAFFEAFDGANRYGPLFDESGLVYFDAQRRGPSVDLSDIDWSDFHTYRVESAGSTSAFTFSVDGSVVFTGNAATTNATRFNGFEWGDGLSTAGNGADVDWDYVAFGQPILVPTLVAIDIKPGSEQNNVNICGNGGLNVAILSTETFDATQVDPLTVDLSGAAVRLVGNDEKPQAHQRDVNSDGITDLVVQVEATDISLEDAATEAILSGRTFTSEFIEGGDAIKIQQVMCVRTAEGGLN